MPCPAGCWLLALPLRLAIAIVFCDAAQSHLANWDMTLVLFADEYKLPLPQPNIAADVAVSIEVGRPSGWLWDWRHVQPLRCCWR